MAVAQDPAQGAFAIWQAGTLLGAEVYNSPGTMVWNELLSRDAAAARAFYPQVFGHLLTDIGDETFEFSTLEVEGSTVGGIGALPPGVPAAVPSHWKVYFAADDTDALVARAEELGADVRRAPSDTPYGRLADLADPQGALFSVIKPPANQ